MKNMEQVERKARNQVRCQVYNQADYQIWYQVRNQVERKVEVETPTPLHQTRDLQIQILTELNRAVK